MKKGFTLIEVMVVAVIVAILAAVAIPAYNDYIADSADNVAKNAAGALAASAAAYYQKYNAVPTVSVLNFTAPESVTMSIQGSNAVGTHSRTGTDQQVAWR